MSTSTLKEGVKNRLAREVFLPTSLSIAWSPVYIIRNGLHKNIAQVAPHIRGNILDFGCGSKPYESLFVNATNYVGVDIKTSGHDHNTSKVDVFYDGKTLPFSSEQFDAVVCFEVLEHVFNIDEVITEISRVIKPDGLALITIPFAWEEHEAPYDFARYTSYGIKHVLQENGLEVLEVKKSTTYFLAVCQMLVAYLAQHVGPQSKILGKLFQLIVIFPINVLALALNMILPKRDQYFCNCIALARKASPKK